MARIYISYSSKDPEIANFIADSMKASGHIVFFDEQLQPGDNYNEKLMNALAESDVLIVIITENSIKSTYVNSEIGAARIISKNKPFLILPVISGGINPPSALSDLLYIEWDDTNQQSLIDRLNKAIANKFPSESENKNDKNAASFRHGSIDGRVAAIQQMLKKTVAPKLFADGDYGPSTAAAVKTFQKNNKLEVTGEVDEETFKLLEEEARKVDLPPAETTFEPETESDDGEKRSYWILKMNSDSWQMQSLIVGSFHKYRTHDLQSNKRVDYDQFERIKKGDTLIGYAFGAPQTFICEFVVTEPIHIDDKLGESIGFKVVQMFQSVFPSNIFNWMESLRPVLSGTSPIRLIAIAKWQYDEIIFANDKLKTDTPKTVAEAFYTKSRFSIRDGNEPVLGVTEIAKELAELIRNLKTKEYGRMVGVFGNWGRGKTFMVEQVWKAIEVEKNNPFIRVNFHAWKYQDTHASWAYLYEAFAKKYFSKPKGKNAVAHFFSDFGRRFNLNLLRHGFWPLVRIGISVGAVFLFAWLAMHKTEIDHLEKAFWYLLTTAGIADSVRLVSRFFREHKIKEKATEVFKVYFEKPSFKDLLGVQSEIQNELRSLLKCWIREKNGEPEKQILLFVDDIDRCSEERIVQIIDALRVMLEDEEISKRVVVVAAIDERVLRRAIKWKYKELLDADRDLNADENGKNDKWLRTTLHITSEYMDKLFLAGIKLGTLTANEREEIYRQFSNGRVEVKNNPTIEKSEEKPVITEPEKQKTEVSEPVYQKPEKSQENETLNIILGLGSSPTPPPNEPTSLTQKAQETSFELSFEEDNFLNALVRNLHDVTPRQIRIFYYRYILARNLLTVGLTTGKQQDAFDTNGRNELLGRLLAHYTTLRSNEQLLRDRMLYNALTDKNVEGLSIRELVAGHPDNLVMEILEALEMVIAY